MSISRLCPHLAGLRRAANHTAAVHLVHLVPLVPLVPHTVVALALAALLHKVVALLLCETSNLIRFLQKQNKICA